MVVDMATAAPSSLLSSSRPPNKVDEAPDDMEVPVAVGRKGEPPRSSCNREEAVDSDVVFRAAASGRACAIPITAEVAAAASRAAGATKLLASGAVTLRDGGGCDAVEINVTPVAPGAGDGLRVPALVSVVTSSAARPSVVLRSPKMVLTPTPLTMLASTRPAAAPGGAGLAVLRSTALLLALLPPSESKASSRYRSEPVDDMVDCVVDSSVSPDACGRCCCVLVSPSLPSLPAGGAGDGVRAREDKVSSPRLDSLPPAAAAAGVTVTANSTSTVPPPAPLPVSSRRHAPGAVAPNAVRGSVSVPSCVGRPSAPRAALYSRTCTASTTASVAPDGGTRLQVG